MSNSDLIMPPFSVEAPSKLKFTFSLVVTTIFRLLGLFGTSELGI